VPPVRWRRPRRSAIAPHPLELPWFRVDGPRDRPDAPTFVLVHGVGLSHRSFSRLAGRLSGEGPVVSMDLPGHGRARRARHRATIEELADAVAAGTARRVAGSGPVVLLGHSLGAEVATETVRRHPALAGGLVLVGPVVDPAAPTALRQGLRLLRDMPAERPLTMAMVTRDYARSGPLTYGAGVRSMVRYATADRVAGLELPLLVVRGAQDPIATARWADQLAAGVADGTVVHVPRAVHNLVHSHSAEVARAVLAFTARITQAAPGPVLQDGRPAQEVRRAR